MIKVAATRKDTNTNGYIFALESPAERSALSDLISTLEIILRKDKDKINVYFNEDDDMKSVEFYVRKAQAANRAYLGRDYIIKIKEGEEKDIRNILNEQHSKDVIRDLSISYHRSRSSPRAIFNVDQIEFAK